MAEEVTREWIDNYINTQPDHKVSNMVGRALVALYNRQTPDERQTETATHDNHRGFDAFDAKQGTEAAQYFIKYGCFYLKWQWQQWTRKNKRGIPRIAKYAKQLNEVAEEKRAKSG